MGRTPKPISFLVMDPALLEWDEVKALQTKGHTVEGSWCAGGPPPIGVGNEWDAIIGPKCWMMNEALRPMFKIMVQGVRDAKYKRGKTTLHEPKNEALEAPAPVDEVEEDDSGA